MIKGKYLRYRRSIGDRVRGSLLGVFNVPNHNWFEVISAHPVEQMPFDRYYLGIQRNENCVFIQVTLDSGNSLELKKAFYKAVVDGLHKSLKIRREDVFISLVEIPKEKWSLDR